MRTAYLSLPFAAVTLAAQSVLTVHPTPGAAMFTTIQAAVNAAQPGDTVLVRRATYQEDVTITKPLTLTEDRASVTVYGRLAIRTIAAGTRVVVHGLGFSWGFPSFPPSAAFEVTNCAGDVWIQDGGYDGSFRVVQCASVALQRCNLEDGRDGSALLVDGASVYATGCWITGNFGGVGGNGADGCTVNNGLLYLGGCTIRGGNGGPVADRFGFPCASRAGNGGNGVTVNGAASRLAHVGTTFTPGNGGVGQVYSCSVPNGAPGVPIATSGNPTVTAFPGSVPVLELRGPPTIPLNERSYGVARSGESRNIVVTGTAGDAVLLGISFGAGPILFDFIRAPLLLGPSFTAIPLGSIPPVGIMQIPFDAPGIPAGQSSLTFFLQVYALNAQGVIGGPGYELTVFPPTI